LGPVLTQKNEERKKYVVAYASISNNNVKSHYSSYEGEALGAIWVIAHSPPYLFGQKFTLVTDHQPLK